MSTGLKIDLNQPLPNSASAVRRGLLHVHRHINFRVVGRSEFPGHWAPAQPTASNAFGLWLGWRTSTYFFLPPLAWARSLPATLLTLGGVFGLDRSLPAFEASPLLVVMSPPFERGHSRRSPPTMVLGCDKLRADPCCKHTRPVFELSNIFPGGRTSLLTCADGFRFSSRHGA